MSTAQKDPDFDADPKIDHQLIEQFIRDQLSLGERKEAAVIIDGCASWTRAYDDLFRKIYPGK